MNILVTGCAGFIGFHLSNFLIRDKSTKVIGIDNLNSYYDVKLKKNRLKILLKSKNKNFYFKKISIDKKKELKKIFEKNKIDIIVNLAAQAGVRYSIDEPTKYFYSNVVGFYNVLELAKDYNVKHLIFASSSSVYGDNRKLPLDEKTVTNPIQFYAASKISNEVMASTFSKIYRMRITGLRFFTVYGPWGRPDMALFSFTKNILNNEKIEIYNNGNNFRDFTYVDDITLAIAKIIKTKKFNNLNSEFNIFNLGSGKSTNVMNFVKIIENYLGLKAKIIKKTRQKGDAKKTHAKILLAKKSFYYQPKISLRKGIPKFIDWFKTYYKKK